MTMLFKTRCLSGPCAALALLLTTACDSGSSDESDAAAERDASDEEDAGEEDAEQGEDLDGGDELDAGSDAAEGDGGEDAGIGEKLVLTTVSATGHDRYYAVTHDKDGNIFAVGQTASTNLAGNADNGDYALLIAKYLPSGELDTTFGDAGTVTHNVVAANVGPNREVARGVVVQSTGKIVVAATVPHVPAGADLLANDTDIAVLRFGPKGKLDTAFGNSGVQTLDLTTAFVYQPPALADGGVPNPALSASDQQYSLTLAQDDKLVVHGVELGAGNKKSDGTPRADADWSLIRLTKDGQLDTTFNTKGRVTLDIAEGGASARAATVLSDGSVIGVGYTSVVGVLDSSSTARTQPVLFKVKSDGSFDPSFATADQYAATPGVFYDFVTPKQGNAEAYGAIPQGDKFVTLGYGPTDSGGSGTDFIFARFNQDGSHDKGFGNGGATYLDPGGYGDNGRALTVLEDMRILGAGGGRKKPETAPAAGTQPPLDAMLALLKPDGKPDTSFGQGGMKLYDLGGPSDFFWGVSLAPDKKSVAVVGIASAADATKNDEGALLILKLP